MTEWSGVSDSGFSGGFDSSDGCGSSDGCDSSDGWHIIFCSFIEAVFSSFHT